MIIDWRDDDSAQRYTVVDAETREVIHRPIYWADDSTNIFQEYLKNEDGAFYLIPGTDEIAWQEVRPIRRFHIVLKTEHADELMV